MDEEEYREALMRQQEAMAQQGGKSNQLFFF
jgi:hypothetical protein